MSQPQGSIDPSKPGYVCKLHKSLYGLKQAPQAWFERFTTHLLSLSFTASIADPSLFVFHSKNAILYLLLYVDDIIITGLLQPLSQISSPLYRILLSSKTLDPFTISLVYNSSITTLVLQSTKPNMPQTFYPGSI